MHRDAHLGQDVVELCVRAAVEVAARDDVVAVRRQGDHRVEDRRRAGGQGEAAERSPQQAPVQKWTPARSHYLQFLVDSRHVYRALEEIVDGDEAFARGVDETRRKVRELNELVVSALVASFAPSALSITRRSIDIDSGIVSTSS